MRFPASSGDSVGGASFLGGDAGVGYFVDTGDASFVAIGTRRRGLGSSCGVFSFYNSTLAHGVQAGRGSVMSQWGVIGWRLRLGMSLGISAV